MVRKKELMKRIIYPVMEEMGFTLVEETRGAWEWMKEVEGVNEVVSIYDLDHRISLMIGEDVGDTGAVQGEKLLQTLEKPRTTEWDWSDQYKPGDRRERYEDILLDFRDILLKNCDTVLREHAEKIKKQVPNRRHFEYMCAHREELLEEYREKLGIDGSQNIMETFDIILEGVRERLGKPLEEVEKDLLGYAVLLEAEILRLYGGVREVSERYGSVMLSNVGKGLIGTSFNTMTTVFWVWKNENVMEDMRKEIRQLYEDNLV
ncbi:MAG: hypothetical protein NC427_06060 [Ruminococcus flavefaciens]|nr:hypothetical protein [Ruminococcus flavefaciens]